MAADLTLDGVLARIVEIARQLTGARYAALGVLELRPRQGTAHLHPPRHDTRPGRGDRRPADRSRDPGPADRPTRAAAAARHRRAPGVVRLPAAPPADALVPRGAGPDPRPGLRQPLPDGEDRATATSPRRTRRSSSPSPPPPVWRSRTPGSTRRRAAVRRGWRRRRRSPGLLSGSGAGEDALQVVADRAREVAAADVAWLVAGHTGRARPAGRLRPARRPGGAARRSRWTRRSPAR